MPSGYDKSPDYGGPEPTWRGIVIGTLAFIGVAALVVLYAAGWFQDGLADNKARTLQTVLGKSSDPTAPLNVMRDAFARITAKNIPVYVAAGNTGPDPLVNALALFPGVHAVGALNADASKTAYTNDSSLVSLWQNGRFVFTKVAGGVDINGDGTPEYEDLALSKATPVASRYAGLPVSQTVSQVPGYLLNIGGDQAHKIHLVNRIIPEGLYPAEMLLTAYGYAVGSGNTKHSLKEGQWMHRPSLLIFSEDEDGKLVFDPQRTGEPGQRMVWDATSYATPNICAKPFPILPS